MRRSTGVVLKQRVALAVIAVLAIDPSVMMAGGGPPEAAPRPSPVARMGSLAVESEPAGAAVYVDGQLTGQTPLQVASLTAGDHRVRLVKGGYLENARVVSVSATRSTVRVQLTRDIGSRPELAAQLGGGGGGDSGGGGSKLPLILALAGGGAIAGILIAKKGSSSSSDSSTPANQPPTAGSFTVSPTTAILNTVTTFTAAGASDPEGDALSFSWNFGDGTAAGTGATTTHTYTTAATFPVTLTVSATGGSASTAATNVIVKNLNGGWTGSPTGWSPAGATITLTQTGTTLAGGFLDSGAENCSISGGSVNATTRLVTFSCSGGNFSGTIAFSGTPNAAATSLVGTCSTTTGGTACPTAPATTPWTLTRP